MADNLKKEIIVVKNITKTYPGVKALDNVSVSFTEGEVHALVGENGSGKSTLINVISGAVRPDSGSITLNGTEFKGLSPIEAKEQGIAVIHQELIQYNAQKVYENIFMEMKSKHFWVDDKHMRTETEKLLRVFNSDVSPDTFMRDLSTANCQIVAIAKAMAQGAKIVIMDEPTASISLEEQRRLSKVILQMKASGITVIYISHRLEELFEICDRVTVLCDGRFIATKGIDEVNKQSLIKLMVGRELTRIYPEGVEPSEEVVMKVENLAGNGVQDISFELRKGEILGFAGLVGAGRTELMNLIMGAASRTSGEVYIEGKKVSITSPTAALDVGISIIPEDRKTSGCHVNKPIYENISVSNIKRLTRGIIIDRNKERKQAEKYKNSLNIKTPDIFQKVVNLSGGNQQKVVVAKALASDPDILIFDEPTRGVDIGSRHEIYEIMISLAKKGKSILMVSSDMEELLGMSARILVLRGGQLAGEVQKEEYDQEKILELASGMGGEEDVQI